MVNAPTLSDGDERHDNENGHARIPPLREETQPENDESAKS